VATGASKATVAVARQKCVRKRCSWKLVTTRAYRLPSGILTAILRVRLPAGRAKVTVTASGAGKPASRTTSLTLR
jgi:hypothetical protein